MGDNINGPRLEAPEVVAADLRTQLNRAYLSGDGAAVESVMAMLAAPGREAAEKAPDPTLRGPR